MDAKGRRIGWSAMLGLALAGALAAGGVAAEEALEVSPDEGADIILSEGDFDDGDFDEAGYEEEVYEEGVFDEGGADWDVAEGGEAVDGGADGGEEVWLGGDDPDSLDGWEIEGEVVVYEMDADPSEPTCGGCEVQRDDTVGEDLAESGGSGELRGDDSRVLTRGSRVQSNPSSSRPDACDTQDFRGAWLCAWSAGS